MGLLVRWANEISSSPQVGSETHAGWHQNSLGGTNTSKSIVEEITVDPSRTDATCASSPLCDLSLDNSDENERAWIIPFGRPGSDRDERNSEKKNPRDSSGAGSNKVGAHPEAKTVPAMSRSKSPTRSIHQRSGDSSPDSGAAKFPELVQLDRANQNMGGTKSVGAGKENVGGTNSDEAVFQGRLEATPELLAELHEVSLSLENATPQEILQWAVDRFQDQFTFATAFGPEGMTILHFLAEVAPHVRVFNLDTGYQFAETLQLRDRVAERYGIDVELVQPETSVEEYEAIHGGPLYLRDSNQCCFDRKIVVLRRALMGYQSWASAIRRDQSPDRANIPIVGWDAKFRLVKVSPLATWKKDDIWRLIMNEKIPYNPLHDQGYPSIGCRPCTRAVQFGEDERAGRWSGQAKTECGLHSLGD